MTTRAPTVGTFHAAASSSPIYAAFKPLLTKANARLKARSAVSEAAGRLVTRYFPNHLLATPNGIDAARFADVRSIDLGSGQHVLFLGRLEPRKGPDVLVNAMGLLRDLNVTLVVAGEGGLRSRLETTADRLRVKVRFLGEVSEEDKARLYRSCEIYCAPNLRGESFGIVLVEAMASGCPVVCSDLKEFKTVTGDAALFSPAGEPAPLARAIRTLLSEPARREQMRSKGIRRAQAFDWGGLVPTVESIYRQACLAGKNRAHPDALEGHD
jgi:phosphatidylinositol alpha-mannosyltransferase